MKLIVISFLLLSLTVFSQVSDSIVNTTVSIKENLANEKNAFESTTSQENRNQQYLTEIQKNASSEDNLITKKEIDKILQEPTAASQMQMMSITVDSKEIEGKDPIVVAEPLIPIDVVPKEGKKEELSDLIEQLDDTIKKEKKIIGPSDYDTRIELLQLKSGIAWQLAIFQKSNSVALVVEKEKVSQISKEIYTIDISQTLGKTYNLCVGQAFYEQPIVGIGTAFIFSENSMMTAKHVFERPVKDYVVVFGYQIVQSNGVVEVFFDNGNLYYPTKIIHSADELDVVEFEVDRNFDRKVLEWENSLKALKSTTNEIYMLGHPCGLPMKVALNASIEKNPHPQYFYTTLDSYQGNSGSPVFNFYSHKVIGVLVSGDKDYKYNGNCYYRSNCILPYCKGEKVIRIEEIIKQF